MSADAHASGSARSTHDSASAVEHLAGQNRYVYSVDGREVGLTDYQVRGSAMHLIHTEISPALRGHGLGARMVQEVLDRIRVETTYRVVADCPFIADWLDRHPDYQELEQRGA